MMNNTLDRNTDPLQRVFASLGWRRLCTSDGAPRAYRLHDTQTGAFFFAATPDERAPVWGDDFTVTRCSALGVPDGRARDITYRHDIDGEGTGGYVIDINGTAVVDPMAGDGRDYGGPVDCVKYWGLPGAVGVLVSMLYSTAVEMRTEDEAANEDLLDAAIEAAVKAIQDRLGVTSGDLAAQMFSGVDHGGIDLLLQGYIDSERAAIRRGDYKDA